MLLVWAGSTAFAAKPETFSVDTGVRETFDAAQAALLEVGYSITSSSRDSGTISAARRGLNLTLLVAGIEDKLTKVTIATGVANEPNRITIGSVVKKDIAKIKAAMLSQVPEHKEADPKE
jgi:hypothetical protein